MKKINEWNLILPDCWIQLTDWWTFGWFQRITRRFLWQPEFWQITEWDRNDIFEMRSFCWNWYSQWYGFWYDLSTYLFRARHQGMDLHNIRIESFFMIICRHNVIIIMPALQKEREKDDVLMVAFSWHNIS